MHLDPSSQANWSEEQERESEVAVASFSWTTPTWMLRTLMVKRNLKEAKGAIVYYRKQMLSLEHQERFEIGRANFNLYCNNTQVEMPTQTEAY